MSAGPSGRPSGRGRGRSVWVLLLSILLTGSLAGSVDATDDPGTGESAPAKVICAEPWATSGDFGPTAEDTTPTRSGEVSGVSSRSLAVSTMSGEADRDDAVRALQASRQLRDADAFEPWFRRIRIAGFLALVGLTRGWQPARYRARGGRLRVPVS